MDKGSVTRLEDLPSDIWDTLSRYMTGFEIVRLTRTGAPLLSCKLYRSHVSLDFQWSAKTQKIGWPRSMVHFLHLKHFAYNSGRVASSVTYYPTVKDMQLMPTSIEEIYLRCDGAEVAFRNANPELLDVSAIHEGESDYLGSKSFTKRFELYEDPKQWFNAAEYWPNLRILSLHQFSSYAAETGWFGPHFSSLPSKLHTLILSVGSTQILHLDTLPRGLSELHLPDTPLNASDFSDLPPTLEKLECVVTKGATVSDFRFLPRSLRRLAFRAERIKSPLDPGFDDEKSEIDDLSSVHPGAGSTPDPVQTIMAYLPPLFSLRMLFPSNRASFAQHQVHTATLLPSLVELMIDASDITEADFRHLTADPHVMPHLIRVQALRDNTLLLRFPGQKYFHPADLKELNASQHLILEVMDTLRLNLHTFNIPSVDPHY